MLEETFDDYMEIARSLLGGHESADELWEANDYVNLALILRPDDAQAWLLKSQILSALEDDPAALAAVEMAVRQQPHSAEACYVRAAVLADMDRCAEAMESIELAFAHLADDDDWLLEDLFYEKAALLDALDRSEEALETLEAGLRHCPNSALLRAGVEPLRRERVRRSFRVIEGGLGQVPSA
jgi:tetratricopeptide (TPR) repeat protein